MRLEAVATDYSSREQWHPDNDLETGVNAARNILLAVGPVVPMAQWNLEAAILKSEQIWIECTLCQWRERCRDAWHMMTMWGTTMREDDVRGRWEKTVGEDGGERMLQEDVASGEHRVWQLSVWMRSLNSRLTIKDGVEALQTPFEDAWLLLRSRCIRLCHVMMFDSSYGPVVSE